MAESDRLVLFPCKDPRQRPRAAPCRCGRPVEAAVRPNLRPRPLRSRAVRVSRSRPHFPARNPMNLFAEFQDLIAGILRQIAAEGRLPADLDFERFSVEPPRDPGHGDLATNAAMVYGKEARAHFANPRQLAEAIAAGLRKDLSVASVEVAGPGFINIRLNPAAFARVLRAALSLGPDYARPAPGAAQLLEMRSPISGPSRAIRSRANITSTTPARRSMSSPAPPICATPKRLAKRPGRFPKAFIPAAI